MTWWYIHSTKRDWLKARETCHMNVCSALYNPLIPSLKSRTTSYRCICRLTLVINHHPVCLLFLKTIKLQKSCTHKIGYNCPSYPSQVMMAMVMRFCSKHHNTPSWRLIPYYIPIVWRIVHWYTIFTLIIYPQSKTLRYTIIHWITKIDCDWVWMAWFQESTFCPPPKNVYTVHSTLLSSTSEVQLIWILLYYLRFQEW